MIDKDMENFPKKDMELKNKIRMNSYYILEIAYYGVRPIDSKKL